MTPAEQAARVQRDWLAHPCWTEGDDWGETAGSVLDQLIAAAIEQARQEEREACAKLADEALIGRQHDLAAAIRRRAQESPAR